MVDSSLARTARALDLIPFLLSHQGISIEELAAEFAVTGEQIGDDLNLLFVCGLPGYTPLELIDLSFESGYVTVTDPQNLQKPRTLTVEETAALIIGLDALRESLSHSEETLKRIVTLQDKLRTSNHSEDTTARFALDIGVPSKYLPIIERALLSKSDLDIEYLNLTKDELKSRRITPIYIYSQENGLYLNAWCHLASGERNFRVAQIQSAEPVTTYAEDSAKRFAGDREPIHVTLEIRAKANLFIEENSKVIDKETTITTNSTIIEIRVWDELWLLRSVLAYSGAIKIEAPLNLAKKVKEIAENALKLYS